MATKRVLKQIRLDKIAAVGSPCQEPALAAIIKHAPPEPDGAPPAIAKKTFQEALNAQLVSEKISDTFWRAFENQWAVREAFRTALTDEIADGGDGTDAVDGFAEAMQQIATLAAEAARNAAGKTDADLESAVEEAINKWLADQPEKKETPMPFATKAALLASVAKFDPTKTTMAEVADMQKHAVQFDCVADLPVALAPPAADTETAVLKRRLDIAEMSPEVRKHFDGLDDKGKDAFLAKSVEDRASDVEKANATDPVVHKCLDGTEIRKSDGAAALALAKRGDAQEAELAKLRGEVATGSIEKRAAKYPNVAKTVAEAMLKSIDQVGGEDTEAGKAIVKNLETMNAAGGRLHKSLGSTEGGSGGADENTIAKARGSFDAKVQEIVDRDKIDKASAMSKARIEAPDLFAEAYPSSVAADADA